MTAGDESGYIHYQLDCGRWVTVDECYIGGSMLGYLAGSPENPRLIRRVIEHLPETIERYFGKCHDWSFIKPMNEPVLPRFVFIVYLVSDPISEQEARLSDGSRVIDPISGQAVRHYDGSKLIVCGLCNDITTSLPELIKRETHAIEWNKNAVDFSF